MRQIAIKAVVERTDGKVECARGLVTGFAPNGNVRVHLTNGQRRIWPLEKIKVMSEPMPYWDAVDIERMLKAQPTAVRVRFSTSLQMARVDIFQRAGTAYPSVLIAELEERGWKFGDSHPVLIEGVSGYYYEHSEISADRLKDTQALVTSYGLELAPDEEEAEPVALPAPAEEVVPVAEAAPAKTQIPRPRGWHGAYEVVEVHIRTGNTTSVGRFDNQLEAQGFVNKAHDGDNVVRFLCWGNCILGGVSSKLMCNDEWAYLKGVAGRRPAYGETGDSK